MPDLYGNIDDLESEIERLSDEAERCRKSKLGSTSFSRDPVEVARDLIGATLIAGQAGGIIVEAEAYRRHDGSRLDEPPFGVYACNGPVEVRVAPRIGISRATDHLWRFRSPWFTLPEQETRILKSWRHRSRPVNRAELLQIFFRAPRDI